ncbi:MAG: hypothetical protein KC731_32140 [Myxococcales bacterium]|nr:hypothetical protein [Myxococcales bacterium]
MKRRARVGPWVLSSLLGGCAAAPAIAPASPAEGGVPTAAVPPAPVDPATPSSAPTDQRRATETDQAPQDHRVWVTDSDALPFLQANPGARVEFDKERFLEGEGSDD